MIDMLTNLMNQLLKVQEIKDTLNGSSKDKISNIVTESCIKQEKLDHV